jgi:RNA polymerase sigma-70 factor (ECF subfamily)
METTRSSLIRRVRDPTDAASWREFVALYEPFLLSYVRSKGLADPDGRDVVQDIFVALMRALPGFELEHERGRFRTWLLQVTRNALADWARKQRRRTDAEEEWRQRLAGQGSADGPEREDEWFAAHRQRVLTFVLEQVRAESQPKTWASFEQHLLRGRRSADVAAELSLTANAVYVNAHRVFVKVREQCREYEEELGNA